MASNTVVNTNVLSLSANRNLSLVGRKQAQANNRLASGKRINSAADDAAGLGIAQRMQAQIRGFDRATSNAEDGVSFVQTAEGALNEVQSMAQRIRELAVQASNGINDSTDKNSLQAEVSQLITEIGAMQERTTFNNKKVIDGGDVTLQIGPNKGMTMKIDKIAKLTTLDAVDIGGNKDASAAITTAQTAIDAVSTSRGKLGAYQNRLTYTVNSLKISSENLSASKSRIEDADMATEMMNLTQSNVLQQAATSMLAQANSAPQSVLQLLQ